MSNFRLKQLIFLAKHSIQKKYTNSVFGIIWAVILPLIQSFTFYYFFVEGLRFSGTIEGHPLIMFLITGTLAWSIFSTILTSGSSFIEVHKDLIKNINFSFGSVVLVEVVSLILVHIIVIFVILVLCITLGYNFHISYINFFYFWFVFIIFASAIAYILSIITVLYKDIRHLISAIMVPYFWMTPVMWSPSGKIEVIQKLFNPGFYFIDGYRYTILDNSFFWEHWRYNAYFLFLTAILVVIAWYVDKNLSKKIYDLI